MNRRRVSKIVGARMAGAAHAVISVESTGGSSSPHRREPCEQCPWRHDQVGKFPTEAFRISADTCRDMAPTVFGCHMSGPDAPATCAGFLLSRSAPHNLGVRLALARGWLALDQLSSGVPLFDSYPDMAIANGVARDDPALAACRPGPNDGERE